MKLLSRAALRHNSLGRLVESLRGQNPGGRSFLTGQGAFLLRVRPLVLLTDLAFGNSRPGTVVRGPASLKTPEAPTVTDQATSSLSLSRPQFRDASQP